MADEGKSGPDPLAARELPSAVNSEELMKAHLDRTGGKIITRFPPEPNGYLHIGHAKSMSMNFQQAFEKLEVAPENRATIFRYDDTNPEAEAREYVESLAEDVAWMGWRPARVTHTSDYFDQLFEFALQLIREGKAYVCHQTGEEIKACREVAQKMIKDPTFQGNPNSPWRDRSPEENLRLFLDMKKGKFAAGAAALRLKMDMTSANANMYDQVAYRIKYIPHPETGDTWCIYPTYDYTHCVIDSLEDIGYSICTLEFETRRESYYWVLEALGIYRPKVYEFARLNITHTVLSKRKLKKLVVTRRVRNWDDPRMPTISGLRRRGYTADILNRFCLDIGVTRNDSAIQYERLQYWARQTLHETSPRAMAVLDPLLVKLTNLGEEEELAVPDFPFAPERGAHAVRLTAEIYIDRSDFREEDSEDYYGLSPGKAVGLKYAHPIACTGVERDAGGRVTAVLAEVDRSSGAGRPKGNVTWVPGGGRALACEVRLYDHLFTQEEVPDEGWEAALNPASEVVCSHALVDPSVLRGPGGGGGGGAAPAARAGFQFERLGFFSVDQDSTPERLVFNRTVTLKESGPNKQEGKSRKAEQAAQMAAKEARMRLAPEDLFRAEVDKYSAFDDQGLPTHDAAGQPLTKSTIKKLKKEQDKHRKSWEKAQKK
mmetsp:Transcript_38374/g.66622  ORF Transcript_38374/g.66622 Transcript_38374/m.66622 type:complete len:658 (+) Transcript_38374:60-2033(+)